MFSTWFDQLYYYTASFHKPSSANVNHKQACFSPTSRSNCQGMFQSDLKFRDFVARTGGYRSRRNFFCRKRQFHCFVLSKKLGPGLRQRWRWIFGFEYRFRVWEGPVFCPCRVLWNYFEKFQQRGYAYRGTAELLWCAFCNLNSLTVRFTYFSNSNFSKPILIFLLFRWLSAQTAVFAPFRPMQLSFGFPLAFWLWRWKLLVIIRPAILNFAKSSTLYPNFVSLAQVFSCWNPAC